MLVIEKIDVAGIHHIGLTELYRFMAVNTLSLEDGKEIFRHGIVIQISFS